MAVPVVHRLEAVEIEQRDREYLAVRRARDFFLQPQVERAPVGQPCQRVAMRQIAHLPLQFQQVDKLAVLLEDHAHEEHRRNDQAGARRNLGRVAGAQHQIGDRHHPDAQIEQRRKARR